jgi:hypothetical protein
MTANDIAAQFARRAGAVDGEVRATVRALGEMLLAASLSHMEADIYSKPVDTGSSGQPQWKRTGALKQNEKLAFDPDGAGCRLVNEMPYAEARHELGRGPSGRKTSRPAHWRDEAFEEMRQVVPETLYAMNRRILEGR